MSKILLVDDDLELCQLMTEFLELEGFNVDVVHNGMDALTKVEQQSYDVVVLDIMMPKLNGFDTLRQLRSDYATPVLMMTARGDEVDRIVGFEMGADDYMPKPCSPRELVARLRAIIRRVELEREPTASAEKKSEILVNDNLEMIPTAHKVKLNGERLELTQTEFGLLHLLMDKPGEQVSKEVMMKTVLKRTLGPFDRTIDMHMSNLRRKVGPLSNGEPRIITIRGSGYLLALPEEVSS